MSKNAFLSLTSDKINATKSVSIVVFNLSNKFAITSDTYYQNTVRVLMGTLTKVSQVRFCARYLVQLLKFETVYSHNKVSFLLYWYI